MKECTYEFDEEEIICTTAAGGGAVFLTEQVFCRGLRHGVVCHLL